MSNPSSTPAANPGQGGSYIRHPDTGALTAVHQPAPAVAALRAEAQAPDAVPAAAPADTTADTPAQEA